MERFKIVMEKFENELTHLRICLFINNKKFKGGLWIKHNIHYIQSVELFRWFNNLSVVTAENIISISILK